MPAGVSSAGTDLDVLSGEALAFVDRLHRELRDERQRILAMRAERRPGAFVRAPEDFTVAPPPSDLVDRRVEITGPVERKMMINALNSGAKAFMADFEDACSPTWQNIVEGQRNVHDAARRTISLDTDAKSYRLNDETATLLIRPRGWHLVERHHEVDGAPISASLFDFGLTVFHNAREQLDRGTGPYFYFAKLEGHVEARLWNDACRLAEEWLDLPRGSIRATVLVETITGRVRDGRDPLRAARAARSGSTRAGGTTSSRASRRRGRCCRTARR